MRRLAPLLLLALGACPKTPAGGADTPAANAQPDASPDAEAQSAVPAEEPPASDPALDVQVTGVGSCTAPEDCEWISAPYRSADELRQDSSSCCAMACRRPNMVVSQALLAEAAEVAETVCADHRSGKTPCPPMSPCRNSDPRPYIIEPTCEAGTCGGRAMPLPN